MAIATDQQVQTYVDDRLRVLRRCLLPGLAILAAATLMLALAPTLGTWLW